MLWHDKLNKDFSSSFVPSDIHLFDTSSIQHSSSSSLVVSEFDVFRELKSIRSSHTADVIPGWLLKRYAHELAAPLAHIFNRCFEQCYFPDIWKLASIRPIPKGGSSFRPISLLPCFSKLLERLFVKQLLIPSLQPSFNVFQFGFLPTGFGGCSNAVTYTRLRILEHLSSSSGYVRFLQLDLSKAFDRASHAVILSSLHKFVPDPFVCSFVRSFLSNRWQWVVSSSGHCSSWSLVTSGIPQGSVLGPILFAWIRNEFPTLSSNSKLIACTDDLAVLPYVSSSSDNLQTDLDTILHWLRTLQLTVNRDKFKCITFSKNPCAPPTLHIDGSSISDVVESKFLGVILHSNAKTDTHFTSVIKKASRSMYFVMLLWLNKTPPKIIW